MAILRRAGNRQVQFSGLTTGNFTIEKGSWGPENWTKGAACSGKPYLFEEILHGTSRAAGMTEREIKILNASNFRMAEEICSTCPVIEQCYKFASEEDLEFTYRAGLLPASYNPRTSGKPKNYPKSDSHLFKVQETCVKGHDEWVVESDGNRRCLPCRREKSRRHKAKKRAEAAKMGA